LPDQSIDCILSDLPYGTTACHWDSIIPLEPMWAQFKRVIKPRGAIVLTASQPFTTRLIASNYEIFKYEWIWEKSIVGGFVHAKNKPLKSHENVLVFSLGTTVHEGQSDIRMNYYPQMEKGKPYRKTQRHTNTGILHAPSKANLEFVGSTSMSDERYPTSVIKFPNSNYESLHPTQKPVALFEYLIRTYTQPGQLVLDPCIGSGTTAVAARQIGRHFIGGDITLEYVNRARARLAKPYAVDMFAGEGAQPADEQPEQLYF
jgi:site-specific DNA-methyltransferase (adenine-specific)